MKKGLSLLITVVMLLTMVTVNASAASFADADGNFVKLYENTLCASTENLKNAGETIAVACGDDKTEAMIGALRTKLIDTLVTDEYTARKMLSDYARESKI